MEDHFSYDVAGRKGKSTPAKDEDEDDEEQEEKEEKPQPRQRMHRHFTIGEAEDHYGYLNEMPANSLTGPGQPRKSKKGSKKSKAKANDEDPYMHHLQASQHYY